MYRQKVNINSLIAKVTVIGLYIFILFAFKSVDCSCENSFRHNAAILHFHDLNQQVARNNSAILTTPISSPNIAVCEISIFKIFNSNTILVIRSNKKDNQLLKNCKEQFLEFKPHIFDFYPHLIRASLSNEEFSSIS